MRSIAHEMTHMMQDQMGLIVGPTRDAGGFHEDQANAKAGEIDLTQDDISEINKLTENISIYELITPKRFS